ncbi:hypothetical protein HDV05_002129, partial [Chytridiales sp. JEL 0842]
MESTSTNAPNETTTTPASSLSAISSSSSILQPALVWDPSINTFSDNSLSTTTPRATTTATSTVTATNPSPSFWIDPTWTQYQEARFPGSTKKRTIDQCLQAARPGLGFTINVSHLDSYFGSSFPKKRIVEVESDSNKSAKPSTHSPATPVSSVSTAERADHIPESNLSSNLHAVPLRESSPVDPSIPQVSTSIKEDQPPKLQPSPSKVLRNVALPNFPLPPPPKPLPTTRLDERSNVRPVHNLPPRPGDPVPASTKPVSRVTPLKSATTVVNSSTNEASTPLTPSAPVNTTNEANTPIAQSTPVKSTVTKKYTEQQPDMSYKGSRNSSPHGKQQRHKTLSDSIVQTQTSSRGKAQFPELDIDSVLPKDLLRMLSDRSRICLKSFPISAHLLVWLLEIVQSKFEKTSYFEVPIAKLEKVVNAVKPLEQGQERFRSKTPIFSLSQPSDLHISEVSVKATVCHFLFAFPALMKDVANFYSSKSEPLSKDQWTHLLEFPVTPLNLPSGAQLKGPCTPLAMALCTYETSSVVTLLEMGAPMETRAFADHFMNMLWMPENSLLAADFKHRLSAYQHGAKDQQPRAFIELCSACALPSGYTPASDPAESKELESFLSEILKLEIASLSETAIRTKAEKLCISALMNGRWNLYRWIQKCIPHEIHIPSSDCTAIRIALCSKGFADLAKYDIRPKTPFFSEDIVNEVLYFIGPDNVLVGHPSLANILPKPLNEEHLQLKSARLIHVAIHRTPMVRKLVDAFDADVNAMATFLDNDQRIRLRPVELALSVDADKTVEYLMMNKKGLKYLDSYLESRLKRMGSFIGYIANNQQQLSTLKVDELRDKAADMLDIYLPLMVYIRRIQLLTASIDDLPMLIYQAGLVWRHLYTIIHHHKHPMYNLNHVYPKHGALLHMAVAKMDAETVKSLLKLHATVDVLDEHHQTPLHLVTMAILGYQVKGQEVPERLSEILGLLLAARTKACHWRSARYLSPFVTLLIGDCVRSFQTSGSWDGTMSKFTTDVAFVPSSTQEKKVGGTVLHGVAMLVVDPNNSFGLNEKHILPLFTAIIARLSTEALPADTHILNPNEPNDDGKVPLDSLLDAYEAALLNKETERASVLERTIEALMNNLGLIANERLPPPPEENDDDIHESNDPLTMQLSSARISVDPNFRRLILYLSSLPSEQERLDCLRETLQPTIETIIGDKAAQVTEKLLENGVAPVLLMIQSGQQLHAAIQACVEDLKTSSEEVPAEHGESPVGGPASAPEDGDAVPMDIDDDTCNDLNEMTTFAPQSNPLQNLPPEPVVLEEQNKSVSAFSESMSAESAGSGKSFKASASQPTPQVGAVPLSKPVDVVSDGPRTPPVAAPLHAIEKVDPPPSLTSATTQTQRTLDDISTSNIPPQTPVEKSPLSSQSKPLPNPVDQVFDISMDILPKDDMDELFVPTPKASRSFSPSKSLSDVTKNSASSHQVLQSSISSTVTRQVSHPANQPSHNSTATDTQPSQPAHQEEEQLKSIVTNQEPKQASESVQAASPKSQEAISHSSNPSPAKPNISQRSVTKTSITPVTNESSPSLIKSLQGYLDVLFAAGHLQAVTVMVSHRNAIERLPIHLLADCAIYREADSLNDTDLELPKKLIESFTYGLSIDEKQSGDKYLLDPLTISIMRDACIPSLQQKSSVLTTALIRLGFRIVYKHPQTHSNPAHGLMAIWQTLTPAEPGYMPLETIAFVFERMQQNGVDWNAFNKDRKTPLNILQDRIYALASKSLLDTSETKLLKDLRDGRMLFIELGAKAFFDRENIDDVLYVDENRMEHIAQAMVTADIPIAAAVDQVPDRIVTFSNKPLNQSYLHNKPSKSTPNTALQQPFMASSSLSVHLGSTMDGQNIRIVSDANGSRQAIVSTAQPNGTTASRVVSVAPNTKTSTSQTPPSRAIPQRRSSQTSEDISSPSRAPKTAQTSMSSTPFDPTGFSSTLDFSPKATKPNLNPRLVQSLVEFTGEAPADRVGLNTEELHIELPRAPTQSVGSQPVILSA